MATEIIATAGDPNANSYATVAEADQFLLEERLGASAWDSVNKTAALIMATQQIERLDLVGSPTSSDQALHFPASGTYSDGSSLDQNEIPTGILRATCELAFWLSQGDRTAVPGGETLQKLKVGPLALDFNDPAGSGGILDQMPDIVRGHLKNLTNLPLGAGDGFRKVARA